MRKLKTKKIIPIVMIAILVITMGILQVASLGSTREVGKTFTVNDLKYNVTSTVPAEVAVTGLATGSTATEIAIPNEVTNDGTTYSATSIGEYAFFRSGIKSIAIPHSVKTIGMRAFRECKQLAKVEIENTETLPSQLETIGGEAFYQSGIKSISIPNSVKTIGELAFHACAQLAEVTIENTETLPSKLETIGGEAFRGSGIKSIAIPHSVKIIGYYAFSHCAQLAEVTIENTETLPSQLETIGGYAFYQSGIKSITIPQSVTTIGALAFYRCTTLAEVTIENTETLPSQLETIGKYAFSLSVIKEISIPQSVKTIGEYAFSECTNLAKVTIENTEILPSQLETIGGHAFNNSGIPSITIPHSVKTIGEYAFGGCGALAEVAIENTEILPSQLETIGEYALQGTAIKEIAIPHSVKTIGNGAFLECVQLAEVTIENTETLPSQLEAIGGGAFDNSGITSIAIPHSVKTIGNGAFFGCKQLAEVTIENTDKNASQLATIGEYAFFGSGIPSIAIPQSVKTIGARAFYYCVQLAEVTIENTETLPSQLETIGEGAFFQSDITSIAIPQSVTSISRSAFKQCDKLAKVTIENTEILPSQLETIGEYALQGTAIKEIAIPHSVKTIGNGAFLECVQLAEVTIENTETLPSQLEAIGGGAFDNSGITSIAIPHSVTSIGERAFASCTKLADVTIENTKTLPSKLETIGEYAFMQSGPTSIVIPQSVTSIGNYAFAWCSELSTIVFSSATVPTFGSGLFHGAEKDITAYVPFAQKTDYETKIKTDEVLSGYTQTLTVRGYGALVLPDATLDDAEINEAGYSQSVAATGGIEGGVVTYEIKTGAGDLPIGLTLNIDGTITGKPTKVASSTFTVTAKVSNALAKLEYSATKEYTIKIEDTIDPTFNIKNTEVTIEINGNITAVDFLALVVITDTNDNSNGEVAITTNFDTVIKQDTLSNGTTVTITATDESGNETKKVITVKVTDTTNPTFNIKNAEVTIEINGKITEADFLALVVITEKNDNSNGEVAITTNFDTVIKQDALKNGTVVTITATDPSNNKTIKEVTVNVTDTIKPVITVENKEVTIEINGNITEADFLELIGFAVTDNSKGEVKTTTDFGEVLQNALGQKVVTITATDGTGNVSTQAIIVNVTDTTAPDLTVNKTEVTIELNGNITEADFLALVGFTTTDNSGKTPTITTDFANVKQDALNNGTTVTITATDESNNEITQEVTVKITDTIKPVITVTSDTINIEINGNITEADFLALVGFTTTDNSGKTPTITTDFPNVKQNALGQTTVTITATDESGNFSTATITVNVTDTTPEPTTVTEETTTGAGTDVATGDTLVTPLFFVMALFSAVGILVSRKRKEELQG